MLASLELLWNGYGFLEYQVSKMPQSFLEDPFTIEFYNCMISNIFN